MSAAAADDFDVNAHVELLHAIAHGVRLELLRMLINGELNVSELEERTGVAQPGLSQQLGVLRRAELVLTRREAKLVFYRINEQRFALLSALIDSFAGTVAVPKDIATRARLASGGGAAMFARVG